MTNKQIKISDQTKLMLDELKVLYRYGTYENCVNSLASFIVNNGIDPTDANIGNFRNSLIDLETRFSKSILSTQEHLHTRIEAAIKIIKVHERDYLVPIKMNLEVVNNNNIQNESTKKDQAEKFENHINANLPKINIGNNDDEKLKGLYKKVLDFSSEIDKLEMQVRKDKKTLDKIFNASKIEQGGMLSKEKIIIEMNIDDWKQLKNNR
jgi:hypothetical protein